MMRTAVVVLVAVATSMVATLAPASTAAAAPAPTTLTLSGPNPSPVQHRLVTLRAQIGAPSAVTGSVVFREGSTVLAGVPIFAGAAELRFASATPGPRTISAEYTGSATLAGSAATVTFTVQAETTPDPMTGALSSGGADFVVGDGNTFSGRPGDDRYDPVTGVIDGYSRFTTLSDELTLPGYGAVGITVYPTWRRNVRIGADGTVTGTSELELSITTITALGLPVDPGCRLRATTPITGSLDDAGLHLATEGTFAPTACVLRTDLVNAALAGPFELSITVPTPFPLPPPPGTATTVDLVVETPEPAAAELAYATATVSAGGFPVRGTVRFSVDGVPVGGASISDGVSDGVVFRQLDLGLGGSVEIRAEYLGRADVLLPSSASVVVDVEPRPSGAPVTGALAIGSIGPDDVADGAVFVGGSFDAASGAIGPGSFWFPQGETLAPFAYTLVQYRVRQESTASGQVAPDGSVSFGPATFVVDVRSYGTDAGTPLEDCTIGPFVATLTGTADVHGLHLGATGVDVPALAPSACNGLGSVIASNLAGGVTLDLEVAGDFRRDGAPTPMTLTSWYPSIARHNHTFLVARLDGSASPPPTGVVVFRDGDHVLGTANVSDTGVASIAVPMEIAGTRTVTAEYAGDARYGAGSATTSIEVVAPPEGRSITGTFTVAGSALEVTPGSALVPGSAPGAVAMSLDPTTFEVTLPTWGTVTVEARLVAAGDLTPPTVEGTSVTGLGGLFVLHIRRVTTATGSTNPLGCIDVVGVVLDGTTGPASTQFESTSGAIEHVDLPGCRGAGRAVAEHLAAGPVTATLTVAN